MMNEVKKITLCGNPNVGKSTLFNKLTGLNQHTGNWPGKTVEISKGEFHYKGVHYEITDLPGTYSYKGNSEDEIIAGEYVKNNRRDLNIVVCDATAVERGLILALQTIDICSDVILCINLTDEAKRKGIRIDTKLLRARIDIPIIETSSKDKSSKKRLCDMIHNYKYKPDKDSELKESSFYVEKAEEICDGVITLTLPDPYKKDRMIDSVVLGKYTAAPIMLLLLGFIFYLTLTFASYPSQLLSEFFNKVIIFSEEILLKADAPQWLISVITQGVMKVLFWVIAVMLPPMAIFFPLFALLENLGYLPRVAFNLDNSFKKCSSCGKQALTMCMGLGCTCAGVTGCRIISDKKERLIATITNPLTPCNGKFPTIFAIISMFFAVSEGLFSQKLTGTVIFTLVMITSLLFTIISSKLTGKILFRNEASSFCMELPPYRKPQISKVIGKSVINKILFVLSRAVIVAAPAGIIIWAMTHLFIGDKSIFEHITVFLDPIGKIIGLDGTILTGFLFGLPANEIVIPVILMGYLSESSLTDFESLSQLKILLTQNGWTTLTAINMLIFTLFHWPCSTAILTIKKETNSLKMTVISILLPTAVGFILCFITNAIFRLICF